MGMVYQGVAYGQPQVTPIDPSIFNKSMDVLHQNKHQNVPSWLIPKPSQLQPYKQQDQGILERSIEHQKDVMAATSGQKKKWQQANATGDKILIFITAGNGFRINPMLDFLAPFAKTNHDNHIAIALAGLPGTCQDIHCAITTLNKYNKPTRPTPPITLDPLAFKRFHVTLAPTIIYLRNGKVIARATGIYNPKWIKEKVDSGEVGDLGNYGEVVAIAEKNMMDVIKERLAKLDTKKMRVQAKKSYWAKTKFMHLPIVTEDKEYMFEPIVRATADIKDSKGNVVVAKGTTVNALSKMAFTKTMIVFNATRKEEIAKVKELIKNSEKHGKAVILIASEIPEKSFDGQKSLEEQFGSKYPVYFLDNRITNTFHVTKTPTVVTSQGLAFIVHEVAVPNAATDTVNQVKTTASSTKP